MKALLYLLVCCIIFIFLPGDLYSQYILNGNANQESCNCFSLTQDSPFQSGTVWRNLKIDLNSSFDFSFNVFLGCNDDGADGIAFVLQPLSNSLGANGQGMGFQGITPSIDISLDTYQNLSGDPSYDHISIQTNGNIDHDLDLAGPLPASPAGNNIEDCAWHVLRVKWDASTKTLSTYFDGVFRLSTQTDIVKTIFNNDPFVYWGFSGSTGVQFNLQKFCTPLSCNFNSNISNDATCFGNPVIFEDHSISFTTIQSYYWDFGDGTTSNQFIPPPHNYARPGTYQVKHSIVAADGCISEPALRTILVGDTPKVAFSIHDSCQTISFKPQNNTTVNVGTVAQWSWQLDGSALPAVESPDLTNLAPGDHTITLAATSSAGCTTEPLTKTFTLKNNPAIDITAKDGCINTPIAFSAGQTDNLTTINSWYWNFGDGQSAYGENTNHVYAAGGLFIVQVSVTSIDGCVGSASKNISIQTVHANAGNDTVITANSPLQLHGSGGNLYSWAPALGLDNPKSQHPISDISEDIKYLLTVTDMQGCMDSASIRIKVFKGSAIYIPTGFTPNNDGRNDILKPAYIGIKSLLYFTIYNRWGQKVFSTNSLNEGWNGTLNGQNLDPGSFVWILNATDVVGKIYSMKGAFTLIR